MAPAQKTCQLEDSLIALASAGDVHQMGILLTASREPLSDEAIQNLLAIAAKERHLDVIDLLLARYPSVPLDESVVRAAVNSGSIPIFEALLARDSSIINMHFEKRGSPLTVACMGRQTVEYLRFLLEAGADPNQDPDAASFPLALVAALYKEPDAIDLLLRHGAHLEHSGALSAAARLGNEPMIHRLLDRGARLDVNAADASPLHVAVGAGHAGVARILLRHGADPHAVDARGDTAIEVAERMGLKGKDMTEMLEALGGQQER